MNHQKKRPKAAFFQKKSFNIFQNVRLFHFAYPAPRKALIPHTRFIFVHPRPY